MNQQTKDIFKTVSTIILFVPVMFIVYAFFHELGHAIVITAYGGTIEAFVFLSFSPYVSSSGGEWTPFGVALNHAAGELLTSFLGLIAIAFYSRNVKFAGYHLCYVTGIIAIMGVFFGGWVVLPIQALFRTITFADGGNPAGFLIDTGFHPLIVSLTVLLFIGAFLCFSYAKGIFTNTISSVKYLYFGKVEDNTTVAFKRKAGIAALGLFLASIVTFTTAFFVPYTPPNIFNLSTTIADVREKSGFEHTFIVSEAGRHQIQLSVQGQGFITGLHIYDGNGQTILGYGNENIDSVMIVYFNEGVHTISFVFLTDFEALVDYYIEIGAYDHVPPEFMQEMYSLFASSNDDFSVSISVLIR